MGLEDSFTPEEKDFVNEAWIKDDAALVNKHKAILTIYMTRQVTASIHALITSNEKLAISNEAHLRELISTMKSLGLPQP